MKLEKEYARRIQRFVPITIAAVQEGRKVDPRKHAAQLDHEARLLEKKIPAKSFLVALDEKGREFTSQGFAHYLDNLMNHGQSEVVFLGGGHLGLPRPLLERSELCLALSEMTLPHELARILLLEQIYRSFSIIRGLPYHR